MNPNEGERLNKYIARTGLCSRRAAADVVAEGRVTVNGEVVLEKGYHVQEGDEVRVDGVLARPERLIYLAMNKPLGVITTMSDPERRTTVVRYLPDTGITVKPVGRLDKDTSGLLLFTNDGELAMRLTHPRYGVEKEYLATVRGAVGEAAIKKLREGVWIEGGRTAPAHVRLEHARSDGQASILRIRIHEGRKRQVRLMGLAVGHPVTELKRIRFGAIRLDRLPTGMCRMLTPAEVDALYDEVGLGDGEPKAKPRREERAAPPKIGPRPLKDVPQGKGPGRKPGPPGGKPGGPGGKASGPGRGPSGQRTPTPKSRRGPGRPGNVAPKSRRRR